MTQASIVKVISPNKTDIQTIIDVLNKELMVATTSAVIHDEKKGKYFQFLSVCQKC